VRSILRWKPSASFVVALVALFVAMGGAGAYAATNLVGHKQLASDSVWHNNIAKGSVHMDNLSSYLQGQLSKTGTAGTNGKDGTNGTNGATGPQGPTGKTGAGGANGKDGTNGTSGATGPQGPAGETGATGPQGPKGDTGATGSPGVANLQADEPYGNDGLANPNITQSNTTVPNGATQVVWAACPAGKTAISGGFRIGNGSAGASESDTPQPVVSSVYPIASEPSYYDSSTKSLNLATAPQVTGYGSYLPNAWAVTVENISGAPAYGRVAVICAQVGS
jgi:hypothetical protein